MVDDNQDQLEEQETRQSETTEATAIEDAGQAIPQAAEDYQELNNRYLRLAADFDNYRKRQAQERESVFKYGAQTTLETLLPVLDNLERAKSGLNENSDPKMLYQSFEMLSQQLLDTLGQLGLTRMHPEGEAFDPEQHEALSQVENPDVPEHTILQVYQDGYRLHDRVLRPARVVVSVKPQSASTAGEEGAESTTQEAAFGSGNKPNPFQQTPATGNA